MSCYKNKLFILTFARGKQSFCEVNKYEAPWAYAHGIFSALRQSEIRRSRRFAFIHDLAVEVCMRRRITMKKVLVGGCFDLLHYGHIVFLNEAKKHGDSLVVALESDENVRRLKGEHRPIHTQKERKTMLEALSAVDEVIPLPPMTTDREYADLVTRLRPHVIVVTQ